MYQRHGKTETAVPMPEGNLERVAGYSVYDRNGEKVGKVKAIWTDQKGQPAFLGVQTSWLSGKTHVVPAYEAHVSHEHEIVRLAYLEEDIKDAPNYDPDVEITYDMEREVFAYYRNRGGRLPEIEPSRAIPPQHTAATGTSTEEANIPLHEEQLRVGKRQVEMGGVRLRKIVRTERVTQPVDLKREEVVIERGGPESENRPSREAFKNEEIFIPLRREEAVVGKETRVTGTVRARKTHTTERQDVSGEVRKEDVDIDRGGDVRRE